jgi:hypothetical protein
MRGKKAKALRKKIYGTDFSPKVKRYVRNNKTGTIRCIEKRAQYQQLKKQVKN